MTSLTLYHADYSTCSQKVRIALAEKAIPYKSKIINFRKDEQLSKEYLAINPNGVVPSLIDNDSVIIDSSCILEYLDESFPEHSLSPESPLGKARMRAWLRYMEEVPTKAIRIPSFDQVFLPMLRMIKSKQGFETMRNKRTLRRGFYSNMNQGKGFDQIKVQDSVFQLRDTVLRMESALKTNKWILGDTFSLVDASLFPLVDRAADLGMTFLWNDQPEVIDWIKRLQARDSVQQAFYKGSRLSERLEYKIVTSLARKHNKKQSLSNLLEGF